MTLQTLVAWGINFVSFGTNIVLNVESEQCIGNSGKHCRYKKCLSLEHSAKNSNRTDRVRIVLAIVGFEMHLNHKHIKGIH